MNRILRRKYGKTDPEMVRIDETLFHSANGRIGVRGAFEEGLPEGCLTVRGSYINGVYETVDMPQAESLYGLATEKQTIVNCAEVQDIRLYLDGRLQTPDRGYEYVLDMNRGVSGRTFTTGDGVTLRFERMASFTRQGIFVIRLKVSNPTGRKLSLVTGHHSQVRNFADAADPRVAAESRDHFDHISSGFSADGISTVSVRTKRSGIGVTTSVFDKVRGHEPELRVEDGRCMRRWDLGTDEFLSFTRFVSFSDSLRSRDTERTAEEEIGGAVSDGAGMIFSEQEGYLSSFWDSVGFSLEGDDELEAAVTYNLYALLESAGRDGVSHLAAKGLSGEGYEGHYFWDTEMYVQPLFTLSCPEISRKLLEYRYSTIGKARKNAEIMGHGKGILYPWRTISGDECSGFFPAGSAQYHINGAVAHAVIEYYEVTGDRDFMQRMGLEMLYGIAELWLDTGVFTERGFEIHEVTGPDEYTCCVSNNYYTNSTAKYDFEKTVRYVMEFDWKKADPGELRLFSEAARCMYLPYDEKMDINPQDDSFLHKKRVDLSEIGEDMHPLLLHCHPLWIYRHQICKQADVTLSHMLYPGYAERSTMLNSLRYYEKITTHDSSLSKSVFGIVSSRLGLADEAYDYFSSSAETDLRNTQGNTRDGIHTANMGGSYLAIIKGFAGLSIDETGISLSPALPPSWKSLSFSFRHHGLKVSVQAFHDRVLLRSDGEILISVNGRKAFSSPEGTAVLL